MGGAAGLGSGGVAPTMGGAGGAAIDGPGGIDGAAGLDSGGVAPGAGGAADAAVDVPSGMGGEVAHGGAGGRTSVDGAEAGEVGATGGGVSGGGGAAVAGGGGGGASGAGSPGSGGVGASGGMGGSAGSGGIGGSAACVGTPIACAQLNAQQCAVPGGGCSVRYRCSGTSRQCNGLLSSEMCRAQAGCVWSSTNMTCGGRVADCADLSSGIACVDLDACVWSMQCQGTATPCASVADRDVCLSRAGCSWSGQGGNGGSGGQGGGAGSLLFSDDFEDGDSFGWSPSNPLDLNEWYVLSGQYRQGANTTVPTYTLAGDATWTDQIVEADLSDRINAGSCGVMARVGGVNDSYRLMARGNGALNLIKVVGGTSTSLAHAAVGFPARFRLKLSVVGTSLKGYVDDVLYLNVTDASLSSGKMGLRTEQMLARFDNVRVTKP